MVLATAVLLLQFSAFPGASTGSRPSPKPRATADVATPAADVKKALPVPTAPTDALSDKATALPMADSRARSSNEILAGDSLSNIYLPPPPAFRPTIEPTERTNRLWFTLSVAEHSSAAFDAWSTRRAISDGRAESDPMMRPFAHSSAIYGAIQVVPFGLDYVARRMHQSTGWTRHVWWVPQSLATATYLFSGSYNVIHAR
ncbi:MAG TPA: hypothetical protein VNK23_06415 [Candidatus Dormibacteraeota bacterium]|nr:hypothetical protein [Candidatus Dormibacteraeota bacterium]